eukprot:COSAG01_NODE_1717_length_9398_cov_83.738574_6_plen_149_part_00
MEAISALANSTRSNNIARLPVWCLAPAGCCCGAAAAAAWLVLTGVRCARPAYRLPRRGGAARPAGRATRTSAALRACLLHTALAKALVSAAGRPSSRPPPVVARAVMHAAEAGSLISEHLHGAMGRGCHVSHIRRGQCTRRDACIEWL